MQCPPEKLKGYRCQVLPMKTFKRNNQGEGGNHVRLNQELRCDSVVGNLHSTHKGLSQGREGDVSALSVRGASGSQEPSILPHVGEDKGWGTLLETPRRKEANKQTAAPSTGRPRESPAQHSLPGYGSGNPGPASPCLPLPTEGGGQAKEGGAQGTASAGPLLHCLPLWEEHLQL